MAKFLSIGEIGVALHVPPWWIDRLVRSGAVTPRGVVGRYRFFLADDLPTIRQALVKAGRLKEEESTHA